MFGHGRGGMDEEEGSESRLWSEGENNSRGND